MQPGENNMAMSSIVVCPPPPQFHIRIGGKSYNRVAGGLSVWTKTVPCARAFPLRPARPARLKTPNICCAGGRKRCRLRGGGGVRARFGVPFLFPPSWGRRRRTFGSPPEAAFLRNRPQTLALRHRGSPRQRSCSDRRWRRDPWGSRVPLARVLQQCAAEKSGAGRPFFAGRIRRAIIVFRWSKKHRRRAGRCGGVPLRPCPLLVQHHIALGMVRSHSPPRVHWGPCGWPAASLREPRRRPRLAESMVGMPAERHDEHLCCSSPTWSPINHVVFACPLGLTVREQTSPGQTGDERFDFVSGWGGQAWRLETVLRHHDICEFHFSFF